MSDKVKDWREGIPLMRSIYDRSSVGCCLHIVLDDHNVEDDSVAFCADEAAESGHADCREMAALMARMSRTQRLKLAKAGPRQPAPRPAARVVGITQSPPPETPRELERLMELLMEAVLRDGKGCCLSRFLREETTEAGLEAAQKKARVLNHTECRVACTALRRLEPDERKEAVGLFMLAGRELFGAAFRG